MNARGGPHRHSSAGRRVARRGLRLAVTGDSFIDAVVGELHRALSLVLTPDAGLPGREPGDGSLASELLQGVTGFRVVASRQAVGPGHLADVDVSPGVGRDAVRCDECARGAAIGAAPMQQDVSGEIEHEDAAGEVVATVPAAEIGGASRPPEGGDVDQALRIDVDIGWPLDVVPDLEELAGQAEDLDPVILAGGHKDAGIGDPDSVRDVELTGTTPELAPGFDQLPDRKN